MAFSLDPQHSALITASAISQAVADARGYESVHDAQFLVAEGYADNQVELVPGLFIPMFDVYGQNGASQFRPDKPRGAIDGKPIKYESPLGARNMLDVHPSMTQPLTNPGCALFITEGIRKADAITSLNYVTVGLTGVWNWRGANDYGGTTALPDFEQIALKDRYVFLVFDSDARTNMSVRSAMVRLREFLRSRGAKDVKIILPPAGEAGAKLGIDDYLAAGGNMVELLQHPFEPDKSARPGRGLVDGGSFLFDTPGRLVVIRRGRRSRQCKYVDAARTARGAHVTRKPMSPEYKQAISDALIQPVKHGTVYAYPQRRCRCPTCRKAWTTYFTDLRRKWRSADRTNPSERT